MISLRTLIQNVLALGLLTSYLSSHAVEIGQVFTGRPDKECEWNAGISLSSDSIIDSVPDHAVDIGICDGRAEAWLSQIMTSNNGKKDWLVIDQLRLGTMTESLHFDWSMVCYIPDQLNSLMWFPILDHSRKRPLTHKNGGILAAWRVNPEIKRFELVPLDLLKKAKCVDETDGD